MIATNAVLVTRRRFFIAPFFMDDEDVLPQVCGGDVCSF